MARTIKVYCPFCRSDRPMWKAGIRKDWRGGRKQLYKCGVCHRQTVNPLKSKPRAKRTEG